ncbi:MAG: helix-turn-helix transcriptional regulator [Clostridia bacterium]|nr:helix-turn-helix transcriptional regulator [Clostridia bacterium]
MKRIGEVLRYAREDLDLTQLDVMKQTGINNKTLSGYENEVSEPDLATFAKLLTLYHLSADEVLEIPGCSGKNPALLSAEERALLQNFRRLSEQQRADFCTMLSAIVQKK